MPDKRSDILHSRNRWLAAAIFAVFLFSGLVGSAGTPALPAPAPAPEPQNTVTEQEQEPEKAIVDYYADLSTTRPGDSVLYQIGNVAYHHNGTFIQCDSAHRYDDYHMEGFGNVIINKDSTYIYGDRFSYDGHLNLAKVYSPLIKLVNGDATMYAYDEMEFDTELNIGRFNRKGVVMQGENFMESERGVYNGDSSTVLFIDRVNLRNENYKMRTDSIMYNMDTEVVTFLTTTYIWEKDSNFLAADLGHYDSATETYHFTKNSYVLTTEQEAWADSMTYHTPLQRVVMHGNIQLLDTTQNMILFGDYGYHDDSIRESMMTRNPSVIIYDTVPDPQTGAVDSAFMRADYFYLNSYDPGTTDRIRGGEVFDLDRPDPFTPPADLLPDSIDLDSYRGERPILLEESPARIAAERADSIERAHDLQNYPHRQVIGDSLPVNPLLTGPFTSDFGEPEFPDVQPYPEKSAENIEQIREEVAQEQQQREEREDQPAIQVSRVSGGRSGPTPRSGVDSLAVASEIPSEGELPAGRPVNAIREQLPQVPSSDVLPDDLLISGDEVPPFTASDSSFLALDSLGMPLTETLSASTEPRDSIERILRAFHNVKMFREDVQAICDSAVAFSVDSMAILFGRPIIWNGDNELTADRIDIFAKDGQIDRAIFTGDPFVTEKAVGSDTLFNQGQSRVMEAYFTDNELDVAVLTGNVINHYYMPDKYDRPDIFQIVYAPLQYVFFEDQEVVDIKYEGFGNWELYPSDNIPPSVNQILPNFSWHPEWKPKDRYDITNRTVRPSIRPQVTQYPLPAFVIESEFEAFRQSLLQNGVWRDRNELIGVTIDTFKSNTLLF